MTQIDNLNKIIKLDIPDESLKLSLRLANEGDLSNLRNWKNEQREFFYYKNEISAEQQLEWFRTHQARVDDYMFIVVAEEISIGCMGIRLLDDVWDVYNVICGSADYAGKGLMSKSFQAILDYAASCKPSPITLQVLKHNPAVSWYQKNGFTIASEHSDHFCMSYQSNKLPKDTQ